ncbi:MAG TPA: hypothetical protein VJK26_00355 [Patescibacteria group bacterium]|nr:hypothetical protein [Patescibacteria group bacterium]
MSRNTLTIATQRRFSAGVVESLPDTISEENALYWLDNLGKLKETLVGVLILPEANWLDRLIQAENDAHRAFFGQTFDLAQFAATLEHFGEDRIGQWAKLGLEPHFFPVCLFQPDARIRGWKVKPEAWFWQQVANGAIKRRNASGELETVQEVRFDGATLLVDTRCKPLFDDGRQMFQNDEECLGIIMKTLRVEGRVAHYDYGPQESRFGASSREWDEQIRPALEACPEFEGVAFRLERVIEANAVPQIYKRMPRKKDGQTNTWVWYEEFFGGASYRLDGGYSGSGGLARVHCVDVDDHWSYGAVRPVGVLDARSV